MRLDVGAGMVPETVVMVPAGTTSSPYGPGVTFTITRTDCVSVAFVGFEVTCVWMEGGIAGEGGKTSCGVGLSSCALALI